LLKTEPIFSLFLLDAAFHTEGVKAFPEFYPTSGGVFKNASDWEGGRAARRF